MSNLTLPPKSVPIDVGGSIRVSDAWYRWATDATARMGGVTGASSQDLTVSQFEDAGVEESKAALYRLTDDMAQAPVRQEAWQQDDPHPSIEALRSEVQELRKMIEALQQGATV